jgi:DNA/RNA-binding domain of Phe-tRNA-synthetase-like protein
MSDIPPASILARATVDDAVYALRPDYRALLIAVVGIKPGPSDATSEALLRAAEDSARGVLAGQPVEEVPHVAAWRDAYRASAPSRSGPGTVSRPSCGGHRTACRG